MAQPPPPVRIRGAVEADQPVLAQFVDDWWGRRTDLLRIWFRQFAGTAFVAEGSDGRPNGFAVGFLSQDDPSEAYLHLIGVAPGQRGRGIGRALLDRFAETVEQRGARTITTTCWPADKIALAFLFAVGFEVDSGPGSQRLYGVPAYADWNREGDDQVVLRRPI